MNKGKQTCKILKEIRKQIAAENDIEFVTSECTYKGDCKGTCPKCETEVRYLERELEKRQRMGKAAVFAGMSLGTLFASTSCDSFIPQPTEGDPCVPDTTEVVNDSTDAPLLLESEMMTPAQDSLEEGKMTPCKSNVQLEIVGQIEEEEWTTTEGSVVSLPDDSEQQDVYQIVDQMPEFPGGDAAMLEFVSKNTHYPQEAREKGIQGRVFVGFVVEKDGSIGNVTLLRGIGYGCDEAAMHAVEMMPKWKPGMHQGEPVRVSYQIPVLFKLEDDQRSGDKSTLTAFEGLLGDEYVSPSPIESEVEDPEKEVYQIVDQKPEFPGGQEAMEKYIKDNIRIGECVSKWQADAVGRIFVNFIVEPDGSLTNVKVLQGIFEPYDEEVVRVVKTMPNWEPGMQRGKPVRVSYTIPIVWRWE